MIQVAAYRFQVPKPTTTNDQPAAIRVMRSCTLPAAMPLGPAQDVSGSGNREIKKL
jgi:hypothetical protein